MKKPHRYVLIALLLFAGVGIGRQTSAASTSTFPYFSNISGPSTTTVGRLETWYVSVADGDGNLSRLIVDWGDKSESSSTIFSAPANKSFTHSYSTTGTKRIEFTVFDSTNLTASTTRSVIVSATSTPPSTSTFPYFFLVSGPSTTTVNKLETWNVSVADKDGNLSRLMVDWGDKSESSSTISSTAVSKSFTHSYSTAGTKRIEFTVFDSTNLSASTTRYVTVSAMSTAPRAPYFTGISGPMLIQSQSAGWWTVSAADSNSDLSSFQVWWGDGTSSSSAVSGSNYAKYFRHSYGYTATNTEKQVSFIVRDSTGASVTVTSTVVVTPPPSSLQSASVVNFIKAQLGGIASVLAEFLNQIRP